MKKYYSYGLIPYKFKIDKICILLVQKRMTNAFGDFLAGRYNSKEELVILLESMTESEVDKIIMSNNLFEVVEKLGVASKFSINVSSHNKFMVYRKFFTYKFIASLNFLKISSNTVKWEFPKGRSYKKEDPLTTAQREFEEETGIGSREIIIDTTGCDSFVERNMVDEREYISKYYKCNVLVDEGYFRPSNEIIDIRWFDETDCMQLLDHNKARILELFLHPRLF